MKKVLILIIVFLSSACDKSKICDESKFCHEIVKGKPTSNLINDSDLNVVKSLFESNNLSLDNFLVYRFDKDPSGNSHVRCYQYINNLNVISDDVIFHFNKQGHYYFLSGEIISNIDIKPSPSMCIDKVITMFLQCVENDGFYKNIGKQIEDICSLCELGYYDLNAGISYADHNFKLIWRVRPKDSEYPIAYINDSDNSLIGYDNGIRY